MIRSYVMRLKGANHDNREFGRALWETHRLYNDGVKVLGDALLTIRAGLQPDSCTSSSREILRRKRSILAVCWLSVESAAGAPDSYVVLPSLVVESLRDTLRRRSVPENEIEEWERDCSPALTAAIRSDAVWVNRALAFDEIAADPSSGINSAESKSVVSYFWKSVDSFLDPVASETDADAAGESNSQDEEPDFTQKARSWVSSNWGTGKKSDAQSVGVVCQKLCDIVKMNREKWINVIGKRFIFDLARAALPGKPIASIEDVHTEIGWKTGRPPAGRLEIDRIFSLAKVNAEDLDRFVVKLQATIEKKTEGPVAVSAGASQWIWQSLVRVCPVAYRTDTHCGMLNQALRRLSSCHSWVKLAEEEREKFYLASEKSFNMPELARRWLDNYSIARAQSTGANSDNVRIRPQAVSGWTEVVKAWADDECKTAEQRIEKVRLVQAQSEEKFGDATLFMALADDSAIPVWKAADGQPDPEILASYVVGEEAAFKRQHFKAPAYRHPDPLLHPVFVEYGTSRMHVEFCARNKLKTNQHGQQASRQINLDVFNQGKTEKQEFLWQSKRLAHEIMAIPADFENAKPVPRVSRLGVAAADAGEETGCVIASGLFDKKDVWGVRLQAPRKQLDEIAGVLHRNGGQWDEKACGMLGKLHWFLTLSAKLEPSGPVLQERNRNSDLRQSETAIRALNAKRQPKARIQTPAIPGYRVLSVDLGHRYAAAAAVWEGVSSDAVAQACLDAGREKPSANEIFLLLDTQSGSGKKRIVYRRLTGDAIADSGYNHATWARLDRQFLIKLPGEEVQPREASTEEMKLVDQVERFFGIAKPLSVELLSQGWFTTNERKARLQKLADTAEWKSLPVVLSTADKTPDLSVVAMMHRVLDVVRLGLKRHGTRAGIAHGLDARCRLLPGGRIEELDESGVGESVMNALAAWRDLASDSKWVDDWAAALWQEQIAPLIEAVDDSIQQVSKELTATKRHDLVQLCQARWEQDDVQIRRILRLVKDFVVQRGTGNKAGKRNMGGLSLDRLSAMRLLYRIQKSYQMRPYPNDLRANIPEIGDESMKRFGRRLLDDLENMRDTRIKTLVSRIIEAALGMGKEPELGKSRARVRPNDPRFAACHCIVVENLRHYKPEALRTRRENRQLLTWSAAKIRDRLKADCGFYGLHFKEVSPAFTSRQDSRTGAGGMRCQQVSVREFMSSKFWRGEVAKAEKDDHKSFQKRAGLLLEIEEICRQHPEIRDDKNCLFLIPIHGGELFVSSQCDSVTSAGLQADLNAAANIGLRALQDPDWVGSWWYVPCDAGNAEPLAKSVGGSRVFAGIKSLQPTMMVNPTKIIRKRQQEKRNVINMWSNISEGPINERNWRQFGEYWSQVETSITGNLSKHNRMILERTLSSHSKIEQKDLPW